MTIIQSLDDLNKLKEEVLAKKAQEAESGNVQVIVGLGSCGIAAGALNTMKAILEQVESQHLQGILVSQTGCSGLCKEEPTVQVIVGSKPKVTYGKVNPDMARRILKEHVLDGKVVRDFVIQA